MGKNYTVTSTVNLQLNARQANSVIDEMRKKLVKLGADKEKAEKAGDTVKVKQIKKEMAEINRLLDLMTADAAKAAEVLARLDKATPKELRRTLQQLKKELNSIPRGSEAWNEHIEKIHRVQKEIDSLNSSMRESQTGWGRFKSFIDNSITGLTTFFGWITRTYELLDKFSQAYANMEQEMANVRKFTGMSAEEVERLNDEFKKIDTRSSREELNQLAQEAGRLGKSSVEDVLGFVRAADKINVALDDLGEGATLTLSKLAGIFGDEERLGTEKALLSVGSVINELSQNCSASAPYLAEFASRMGGVGAQAGMTVQQIMAYGAVLDSNNQTLEKSATAMQQLIVRMYQEPAKYAKVAGLNAKEFAETMKRDANEGLIQFLETISKAGKMDTLSVMFKDMGEKGSGVVATLSTLASNIEQVKAQQLVANEAFRDAVSIDQEFNVQNTTILAGFEKSRKQLNEIAIDLGQKLQPVMSLCMSSASLFMSTLSTLITFVAKNKTEILILAGAITAYQIAVNLAAIKTFALTKAHAAYNFMIKGVKPLLAVAQLAVTSLYNSVQYLTNGLQVNYSMQERWRKSMQAMKFSTWAGLILTVVAAVALLAKKWIDARKEQQKVREEQLKYKKEASELSEKIVKNAESEVTALKALYKAAIDEKNAKEKRIEAAQKLINLYPTQFKNLSTEEIMLGKAKIAYDKLTKSILANAKAKAAAEKVLENEREILELELQLDEARRDYKVADNKVKEEQQKAEEDRERIAKSAGTGFMLAETAAPGIAKAKHERGKSAKIIDENKEKIRIKKEANERLTNQYSGNEAFTSTLGTQSSETPEIPETPEFTGYTHVESEKERKKREREAAAAARRAEIKARKEFKDALKKIKGDRDQAEAQAMTDRLAGEIDYREYLERMRKAEENFFAESMKLYEDNGLKEDADYKSLLEKKADADAKYREQKFALDKEVIEREAKIAERDARYDYAKKNNHTMADQLALQEKLLDINYNKLIKLQSLQQKGSKEWEALQQQIDDLLFSDKQEKQKQFMAKVAEFESQFNKLTVEQRFKLELAALEELDRLKYLKEGQYQEWRAKLEKKYAEEKKNEKNELPGNVSNPSPWKAAQNVQEAFEAKKAQLDDAKKNGVIDEQEYKIRLKRLENERDEGFISKLKNAKSEWVSLLTSMYDAWKDFADGLNDPDANPFDNLASGLEATAAVMSAIMSQVTEYNKAQLEIQVAAIEKRYAREIAFAEGNVYLTKKLEKKKQEEIAKQKEEAANKEFAMQVIGAVAQTAANAIQAYGAGLAVGGPAGLILAPIAAGLAIAQGVLQIATIKKQKEAAAASGYSEGGFTRPGAVDEPAGIVHAGEWVASQKLVNSPRTRPLIDMLEYAQRTNRMPSLSMDDVSQSISAPARWAKAAEEQRVVYVSAPAQEKYEASDSGNAMPDALNRLVDRLDRPIVANTYVAGEYGINAAKARYDRMMSNKNPRRQK